MSSFLGNKILKIKKQTDKLGFRIWDFGFSKKTKRKSLCSLCSLWFNDSFWG